MKSLCWGMQDVIPDESVAAWGARTILRQGSVDVVWDRQQLDAPDEKNFKAFTKWIDKKGLPWLRKEAKNIWGNSSDTHAFDDGPFHLRANAQASYGYLYVAAWMDPQ